MCRQGARTPVDMSGYFVYFFEEVGVQKFGFSSLFSEVLVTGAYPSLFYMVFQYSFQECPSIYILIKGSQDEKIFMKTQLSSVNTTTIGSLAGLF